LTNFQFQILRDVQCINHLLWAPATGTALLPTSIDFSDFLMRQILILENQL
jgi:hypothetical protein